jgi:hypothetical protein
MFCIGLKINICYFPKQRHSVGFEVFTAVVLKSIFFWDMTPCSALSGTRRLGATWGTTHRTTQRYSVYLVEKRPCNACCLHRAGLLHVLLFNPENEGDMFLRNIS